MMVKILNYSGIFFCLFSFLLFAADGDDTCIIRGFVGQEGDGTPLENVRVLLVSQDDSGVRFEVFTDRKGRFKKKKLQPGSYQLTFDREGHIPVRSVVRLAEPGAVRELDIGLPVLRFDDGGGSFEQLKAARQYAKLGKLDDAIEVLNGALKTDAGNFILYFNRGVFYERKEEEQRAMTDYKKSLALKPLHLPSLTALGRLSARRGRFTEAVGYYERAHGLEITDGDALYDYGLCLVNLGQTRRAGGIFRELIALAPGYADAYYQLGFIYLGLGENGKAAEYLGQFIRMDPENRRVPMARELLKTLD